MDEDGGKVILTAEQVPAFLSSVRQAVGMQSVMNLTVAEAMAFTTGVGLVLMTLEKALGGTTSSAGPNAGLPGNDQQQRPV